MSQDIRDGSSLASSLHTAGTCRACPKRPGAAWPPTLRLVWPGVARTVIDLAWSWWTRFLPTSRYPPTESLGVNLTRKYIEAWPLGCGAVNSVAIEDAPDGLRAAKAAGLCYRRAAPSRPLKRTERKETVVDDIRLF